jgi:hypothetical protein
MWIFSNSQNRLARVINGRGRRILVHHNIIIYVTIKYCTIGPQYVRYVLSLNNLAYNIDIPFSFGHYVVCPSIYGFWLPFWYFQSSYNPWLFGIGLLFHFIIITICTTIVKPDNLNVFVSRRAEFCQVYLYCKLNYSRTKRTGHTVAQSYKSSNSSGVRNVDINVSVHDVFLE